jgi:osmotically-inducible protein OsmY
MSIASQPLSQQIQNAVIHNPHLNHRRMQIRTESGRVTLQGSVRSFFEKQMAQEALRKIEGIESIENQLEVTWS